MIDALGRDNHIAEAEEFMRVEMKNPTIQALRALLGACRLNVCFKLDFKKSNVIMKGDIPTAKRIGQLALESYPHDPSIYILLGNAYFINTIHKTKH